MLILKHEYVSGFFDGEGWCVAKLRSNGLDYRAGIGQSSVEVLKLLQEQYGGNFQAVVGKRNPLSKKVMSRWTVTGENAYRFFVAIRPYSIVRAKDIDLMIPIWALRKNHKLRHNALVAWENRKVIA